MRITRDTVLQIIFRALANLNEEREPSRKIPVDIATPLFGSQSLLDSLALVSVISDVEMAVSDEVGEAISLTDDRALGQERSPFSDVHRLSDYILELVNGQAD